MCGRVYMAPADPELRRIVKEMNRSKLAERFRKNEDDSLRAEGEIFPSAVMPVLASNKASEQRIFPMKWGFSSNKGLLINARAETAAEKPTFRDAWCSHRCAIPVSRYYEWEHDEKKRAGQKYFLKPENEERFWLAGLYRREAELPAFVVLTRPAEENLMWMHDRMPVMFLDEAAKAWIRPEAKPDELVHHCLTRICWEKAV